MLQQRTAFWNWYKITKIFFCWDEMYGFMLRTIFFVLNVFAHFSLNAIRNTGRNASFNVIKKVIR